MSTESPPVSPRAYPEGYHPPQPPRQPRKKRLGLGAWLAIALGVILIGCAALFAIVCFALLGRIGTSDLGSDAAQGDFAVQTVDGKGRNKILLIPVAGIISNAGQDGLFGSRPGMVTSIRAMLKAARKDPDIKAILLHIDSPGGGVTASDIIHQELLAYRKEKNVPIVSLFGDLAASGGYYIAAASDRIVAHPTTLTGSIGVVMPWYGIRGLLEKIGVESRPIKSGPHKDIYAMDRAMTDTERQILQGLVDQIHERFVDIVEDGMKLRKIPISRRQLESHCDGRIFSGTDAQKLGFVDELGYYPQAVAAACQVAGISPGDTRVIMYRSKPGFLDLLMAKAAAPQAKGVTINVKGLENLHTPRFYYLWSVGQPSIIDSRSPQP